MICVSIGRGRHKQLLAEHAHLVEQGAELVELRLDYINGEVNLKRLLGERPGPVIITCRREPDGGRWRGSEDDRRMLLRSAIAEGCEYVDLEEDVAAAIPRFGKTKRIISHHDFHKTPEDLLAIHQRLARHDADIVKLATMANQPHDNVRMLQLIKQTSQLNGPRTVGLCMGEIGTPSRILGGKFGSPFTFATFHHERALAPGQLSYQAMNEVFHYGRIKETTRVYGVIADPVGHSLSPVIHNSAFVHDGLDCVYVPFRVPSEYLPQFLQDCPTLDVHGLSVTIPHKETILRHCTKVDGATKGIGAANTVILEEGQLVAFNTDYRAAMSSLDKAMAKPTGGDSWAGKTALILGAGGAARAVAYGIKRRGAQLVIAARTLNAATVLAQHVGGRATEWANRHATKYDVLVNATPVGMHPNVDETPFDMHYLRPVTVVFDMVYNPEQTLLIKEARSRNCKVITGVEMFIGQAALQYQYFTGREAPTDVMRNVMKRTIGAARQL